MPSVPREFTLGRVRMPRIIAALIAAIAVLSIAAAVAMQAGAPGLAQSIFLVGDRVWQGEAWRLLTWPFFEFSPLSLVFGCLTLYWFGSDLARTWGQRRFAGFCLGMAVAAGAFTCVLGLLWPTAGRIPHAGSWAVLDAAIVAWGLIHPAREIRLYGVLRLRGRQMVWLTLAGTGLYAVFYGLAAFVPHFAAELLTLGWLGPARRLPAWWGKRRRADLAKRAQAFDLNQWIETDRRRGR